MERFWELHFDGTPFQLFGLSHFGALLGVLLTSLAVAWVARNWPYTHTSLRYGLALFCLLNEALWDTWQLSNNIWQVAYSLPLHLCTMAVPLSALMLLLRNYRLYELLYFWGFAGATQALLTPDIGMYDIPHFAYWIFFTSHASIWFAVIFASIAWRYRPTWASIGRVFVITNLIMLAVGWINWRTGGNYMYLARPPASASLIDFLGEWPWYIISLELLALVCFVIIYLPFAFYDWRTQQQLTSIASK